MSVKIPTKIEIQDATCQIILLESLKINFATFIRINLHLYDEQLCGEWGLHLKAP